MQSRQTHITNLRASIESTRAADHELKAKFQEVKNVSEKKSHEVKTMSSKYEPLGFYIDQVHLELLNISFQSLDFC